MMKVLGACPNCKTLDTLEHRIETSDASCVSCKTHWDDWYSLRFKEQEKGNTLYWIDLMHTTDVAAIMSPSASTIPCIYAVRQILNAALVHKFKLRPYLATEGGVEGKGFALTNSESHLGLCVEYGEDSAEQVLDFYAALLQFSFLDSFDQSYRAGELLFYPNTQEGVQRDMTFLRTVFKTLHGQRFANGVIKTLEKEVRSGFFSGRYLRGLTNGEIAEFYVPLL